MTLNISEINTNVFMDNPGKMLVSYISLLLSLCKFPYKLSKANPVCTASDRMISDESAISYTLHRLAAILSFSAL